MLDLALEVVNLHVALMDPHFVFIFHVSVFLIESMKLILKTSSTVLRQTLSHFCPVQFPLQPLDLCLQIFILVEKDEILRLVYTVVLLVLNCIKRYHLRRRPGTHNRLLGHILL